MGNTCGFCVSHEPPKRPRIDATHFSVRFEDIDLQVFLNGMNVTGDTSEVWGNGRTVWLIDRSPCPACGTRLNLRRTSGSLIIIRRNRVVYQDRSGVFPQYDPEPVPAMTPIYQQESLDRKIIVRER